METKLAEKKHNKTKTKTNKRTSTKSLIFSRVKISLFLIFHLLAVSDIYNRV